MLGRGKTGFSCKGPAFAAGCLYGLISPHSWVSPGPAGLIAFPCRPCAVPAFGTWFAGSFFQLVLLACSGPDPALLQAALAELALQPLVWPPACAACRVTFFFVAVGSSTVAFQS